MSTAPVIRTASARETAAAGRALASVLEPGDVVALSGDLGAGKTTLTQGVAAGLGVSGPVVSPTFNILLVHPGVITLYHVDLYRLNRVEDLEDIDFYGTLEAGGVTLVEWGDRFPEALPADHLNVSLGLEDVDVRAIEVDGTGPRSRALAAAWFAAWGAERDRGVS